MLYLGRQTNNFFVMKKQTSKPLEELAVDVLDYMFVEWLIRRHLYSKFIKNLANHSSDSRSPRSLIRDRIRLMLDLPVYMPTCLVSAYFPFQCTPEGFTFWNKVAGEWREYLISFSNII